ncbi:MAG: glycosyltransferase family 4 protein [Candidatus Hydrogenedentes bacterium]|nr:glycosyltransferase family 4 protein [Candidatus Hydrogenedentota bacterium]
MLVGVNTLTLAPGDGGGEEVYLRNVLAKMRMVQPATRFVIFTDSRNHDSFDGWDRVNVGDCATEDINAFRGGAGRLDGAARDAKVDLLFSPLRTAPLKCSVPVALYTLDLQFIPAPDQAPRWRDASRIKAIKRLCDESVAIVAPSQFVQKELLEKLGVQMNHSVVAPLGVDAIFERPQRCPAEKPYLLTVGNTQASKNIPRLLQAFAKIREEFPHSLVVVGRPGDAEPEDWGDRVIRIDRFPAAALAGLYQHCDAFVCASLYEGSGVTVLEAMRAGASVVAGRIGGIPEVASTVPLYLNPENVSSIVSTVRRALTENPSERSHRIKAGHAIASEFSWENCAWKTLAAFKRL